MSDPERPKEKIDWRRIGLIATVLLVPGGFLLGGALAARRMRERASDNRGLPLAHVRRDLIEFLDQLMSDDPRKLWERERQRGLAAGIDEIFHFFFDDHGDLDEADIGLVFIDAKEVATVQTVRKALDAIFDVVGDIGDDTFVEHPGWSEVRRSASIAHAVISGR